MINKFLVFLVTIFISSSIISAQDSIPMASMQPSAPKKAFQTSLDKAHQSKNKAAQAKYVEGEIANDNEDYKTAAQKFREAIELDPDFFAAHEAFIRANIFVKMLEEDTKTLLPGQKNPTGLKTRAMPIGGGPAAAMLIETYKNWIAKYPKSPTMLWGLGYSLIKYRTPNTEAIETFNRALAINKKFAPAYASLALIQSFDKESEASSENYRLAYEYDKNGARLYQYARSVSDPNKQKSLYEEVVKRYPKDKNASYALFSLSSNSTNEIDKMNYLEKMWRLFPDDTTFGNNYTMQNLFSMLSIHKPGTALELANAMTKNYPKESFWKDAVVYQSEIIKAKKLVDDKKYTEAAAFLKTIKPSRRFDLTQYYILQAEAEGDGDAKKSYDLLKTNASQKFNSTLNKILYSYGTKLGKSNQQVEDELWQLRVAKAKVFKDFELVRHDTNQPVKLSDYRGKVVFLSFWFPGCGPCIAEFPYLKAAMEKYKSQGLEMIFINIVPKDDPRAIPVLNEHKMDVISLKMPVEKWSVNEYGISGAPTNFLIDTEGRIIFQPKVSSPSEVRDFDEQVRLLISRRNADSTTATAK